MFNLLGWSGCFNWYVNRIIILSKYITVKTLIFRCLNIKMVVIIICFGSRGSQVRILLPRHRKPRSYRNVTPFFCFSPRISSIGSVLKISGALVKLMELFNHSSVSITKRYLGLREEEILETYDCLSFWFLAWWIFSYFCFYIARFEKSTIY